MVVKVVCRVLDLRGRESTGGPRVASQLVGQR